MPALTRRRAGVTLAVLVICSAAVRFAGARGIPGPFVAPDEMIYGLLGRGLWSEGRLSILGADTPFYSLLYPTLVGGPLSLGDRAFGFALLQALQAVVVSATAVIVYCWGRSFLSRGWALGAALLALTPPALAYSGVVLSEVLFVPVTTLAAWALARALEQPSLARQAVLAGAVLAACATRVQGVVLAPVVVTAVVATALFTGRASLMRRFAPTCVALAAAGAAWSGWQLRDGGPWTKVLGGYAGVSGTYDVGEAARFVAWHAADVFLLVAGVPLLALAVLVSEGVRGRLRDPAAAALVATALSMSIWLTVEAGIFASRLVGHLAERYVLAAFPVLFLTFALWLSRGAPRPQPVTSIVALAVAVPALLLPVERFAIEAATQDALMTVPLTRLADASGGTALEVAWLAGVVAVTLAFVFVPARAAPALAVLVGVALGAASFVATDELERVAHERELRFFGGANENWIDSAATGPVTLMHDGSAYWTSVWHQVFWNDRIESVVSTTDQPVPGPLPQRLVSPRFDGTVFDEAGRPITGRLVVAPTSITFRGRRVAEVRQVDIDRAGLALWRVQVPVRLATMTVGLQANGDFSAARVRVFACRPGQLELTLLRKDDRPLELFAGGRLVERVRFGAREFWNGIIPSPPGADGRASCDFDLVSTGLVGSTRIEYVPRS